MKLCNLNNSIDPIILDRGREYFWGGHVLELEEVSDLVFRAEVQGSELYEVFVELTEEGTVLSSECDCPYDYGPVASIRLRFCSSFAMAQLGFENPRKVSCP